MGTQSAISKRGGDVPVDSMFELLLAAAIVVNGVPALPCTLHCPLSLFISLVSGMLSAESQWAPDSCPQSPRGPTYHQPTQASPHPIAK